MTVYFIRAGMSGPIKIGYTGGRPINRLRDLQVGCPFRLTMFGCIEGDVTDEKALHAELDAHKASGEWFNPHPVVIAAVERAIVQGIPAFIGKKRPKHQNPASAIIDLLGGNRVVAEITKSKTTAISQWRKRGKFPSNTFVVLHAALEKLMAEPPPSSLWGMPGFEGWASSLRWAA